MSILQSNDDNDDNIKSSWKQKLRDPVIVLLIIGIIILILGAGRLGDKNETFTIDGTKVYNLDKAVFFFLLIFNVATLVKLSELGLKHGSPVLTTTNYKTSITEINAKIGNWVIFRAGGIKKGIILQGKDGTIIAPFSSMTPVGQNVVLNVFLKKIPSQELPPDVLEYLIIKKLPKPWLWGICTEEQMLNKHIDIDEITYIKEPSTDDLFYMLRIANETINQLRESFKGRGRLGQEVMSVGSRIADRATRYKKPSKFMRFMKDEDEDED